MLKKGRAVVALVFLAAVLAVVAPAKAMAMPVVWSNHSNYVPSNYCANMQCSVQYHIPQGAAFATLCYTDTVNQYGNYWTTRWFYGYFTLASGGWRYYTWVHASYVWYQIWTPHC